MNSNYFCHICGGLVDLIKLQPSGVRLCNCGERFGQLCAENKKLTKELTEQARLIGARAEKELTLLSKIEWLERELAGVKQDAERYRWLRDSSVGPSQIWELLSDDCHPPIMTLKCMFELDAAIDAAMK